MKKTDFFNPKISYGMKDKMLMEQIQKQNPDDMMHVLKTADDVVNHSFLFDMEWDMERTYEAVEFGDTVDWEYNPGDDCEFVWQFNRHRFLICLGQAYQLTGEEKYAKNFVDLMLQFIHNQKIKPENRSTTWRILEIGIRSANWIKGLYLIQDSEALSEDVLDEIDESLKIHAGTIMEEHKPYCYAGNWGMLENHGLFLLGALLHQNDDTKSYVKQALHVLDTGLKMQIMPDGIQLEQSPMYHNEVLRCMLEVIWSANASGLAVPETLKENTYNMAVASLKMLKPNGHQLTMGDSDDMDMRPIMELAAYVLRDGTFKTMGRESLSYENLWLAGRQGNEEYLQIIKKEPEFTSACLYDSGHYIIRSSWDENADMFHFDGGLLGSSHGHSDALHVDWIVNGADVLIDPGRYTYVNKAERFEFKNTAAHNTIMVDDKNFCLWKNSWKSETVTAQSRQSMRITNGIEYAQASHMGYMTLDNPVLVTRKVIHINSEIYLIVDECYTNGVHKYSQKFHFDSNGIVKQVGEKICFERGKTKAALFLDDRGFTDLFTSKQSYHYNQWSKNIGVETIREGEGFQSFFTVCVKGDSSNTAVERVPVKYQGNQEILPYDIAEGIRIVHNQIRYLCIVGHAEMPGPVDLYQIEDCVGCGNVIVFEPEKSRLVGTVLNW